MSDTATEDGTKIVSWQDLVAALITEASGYTPAEIADKVRVERGAAYVEAFRQEFPLWSMLLNALIYGSPDAALNSLVMFNPRAARLPFAREYIAELQKRLRGK